MRDFDDANFNEIAALLHIHKETLAHGPGLSHITDMAYRRLREINEGLNPRKPSTHTPTAFDKEVPPKVVTPPQGPANAAVELPDGEIEPLAPVQPIVERENMAPEAQPVVVEEPVVEPILPGEPVVDPEPTTTTIVERRDL